MVSKDECRGNYRGLFKNIALDSSNIRFVKQMFITFQFACRTQCYYLESKQNR